MAVMKGADGGVDTSPIPECSSEAEEQWPGGSMGRKLEVLQALTGKKQVQPLETAAREIVHQEAWSGAPGCWLCLWGHGVGLPRVSSGEVVLRLGSFWAEST